MKFKKDSGGNRKADASLIPRPTKVAHKGKSTTPAQNTIASIVVGKKGSGMSQPVQNATLSELDKCGSLTDRPELWDNHVGVSSPKPISPKERLKELTDMMKSVREEALLCEECRGRKPICEVHEDKAVILTCREMEILDDLSWFACRLERLRDEPIDHDGSFVAWSDVKKKIDELLLESEVLE